MIRTVKVGVMPGRLVEVAVEEGMTVKAVFDLAGVEVPSGYEVKADSETVDLESVVNGVNLLVATKKIKGNADVIVKVGVMPGRLVEVAIDSTVDVQSAFDVAGIEIPSGYEIKGDGNTVDLSTEVGSNKLLVATKKIKGNAGIVKIGTMPGRLVEVAVDDSTTVKEAFALAGVEILDGYELKADGSEVSVDSVVGDAKMVLQTKRIKGNK